MKRGVALYPQEHGFKLQLSEQRTVVLPYLRWPLWTYWRRVFVYVGKLATSETIARTFLETGHVPAETLF